ncbi:MAG: hypothetical protein JOZ54_20995, partial [Acidobacteria bacterium]|nr:hypothetical protein [Acidobacteriota bacterium]
DVPMRALLIFGVTVVVLGLVIHLMVWGIFKGLAAFERNRSRQMDPMTAVARPADANVPVEPRLQPFPRKMSDKPEDLQPPYTNTPVTDLAQLRAREDKILKNYGWVDPQKQVVHIPIEQAKDLALQRGVFQTAAASTTPTAGGPTAASVPDTNAAPPAAGAAPAIAPVPAGGQNQAPQTGARP